MSKIWSIKYLPTTIEDVKVNLPGNMRGKLINMRKGTIPHLIFSGPPGCGKLTFATMLAKTRLSNIAETMKIITAETPITNEEKKKADKLKSVSSTTMGSLAGGRKKGLDPFLHVRAGDFMKNRPVSFPYKILVIREFQKIRNQESFRTAMEKYEHCRLILTTSNSSAIIDPIMSRCVTIPFRKVRVGDFVDALKRVVAGENVDVPVSSMKKLYSHFNGNIGAAVDTIQIIHISGKEVDANSITDVVKGRNRDLIIPLLQSSFDRSLPLIRKHLDSIMNELGAMELYEMLNDELAIQPIEDLPEILQYMARREFDLLRCNDPRILLTDILLNL